MLRIYSGSGDQRNFGPIINFNVLTADGSIVPPQEVDRLASISNIHLRMGRHCNLALSHLSSACRPINSSKSTPKV